MTIGLEWKNNSSSLVVSTERYGLMYIGNATFTGSAKPESYKQIGYNGAGYSGTGDTFYVYTISSYTQPVPFIQLLGNFYAITSVEYLGGTSWQIVVGAGSWSSTPIIKCFAKINGAGGAGYGIRCFDASGNRTWDSTENMLVMARKDVWSAASDSTSSTMSQSVTMTGISNPYIMSSSQTSIAAVRASGTPVGGLYTMNDYIAGWSWNSGTGALTRGTTAIRTATWKDDSRIFYNLLQDCRSYILSGDLYP